MDECVHSVDFDQMEMVRNRKGRLKMRVGCTKCKNEVTLDHVLASLATKVYNLNNRLLAIEQGQGGSDGQSSSGTDTRGD